MVLGSEIRDPEKNLFRIPDPGVKKAPDPGSGSATLADTRKKDSLSSVLRVREVFPGFEFFHPGSRVKKISDPDPHQRLNITPKKCLRSQKYNPGCSSLIRILIFLPNPDPGSRGQKETGSRILILDTGYPRSIRAQNLCTVLHSFREN